MCVCLRKEKTTKAMSVSGLNKRLETKEDLLTSPFDVENAIRRKICVNLTSTA